MLFNIEGIEFGGVDLMKVYVVFSTETSVVNSMCSDVCIEAVFKNLEDTQKFI